MQTTTTLKQSGFTLIELIIVIVILGILSVTAAPRFIGLQTDARIASLHSLKGSMHSASSLIYGKAVIAGVQNRSGALVDGVFTRHGYPGIHPESHAAFLALFGLVDESEWDATWSNWQFQIIKPANSTLENCHLIFRDARPGARNVIEVVDSGC